MSLTGFLYIIGIVVAFTLLAIFARPLRMIFKIAINSAIGCVSIILFNFVSQLFGIFIGVNALTSVTVGILGLPGFAMLISLRLILG